jgi:drug/metabolite transporter (DMT)-like permease
MQKPTPATLGFIAIIVLSSYSSFVKLLLTWFHPFTIIAIGQIVTLCILLTAYGPAKEIHKFNTITKKQVIALVTMSLLASVIAPFCYLKGLEASSVVNGVLLGRLQPIFLFVSSTLIFKETITIKQIIGICIMLLGTVWITTQGFSTTLILAKGDMLIVLAALCYAGSINIYKLYLTTLSPEMAVFTRNFFGALVFLIIMPLFTGFQHDISPMTTPTVLAIFIGYAVFSRAVGQVLWYTAMQKISESSVAFLQLLAPIFGIIFAVIIVQEQINQYQIIGMILIIAGLLLSIIHRSTFYDRRFISRLGHWHR